MNPPKLLPFTGDWPSYEGRLYGVFKKDIVWRKLRFRGKRVAYRKEPRTNERYYTYWHIITEGEIEEERTPSLLRCERLPWVRWIIVNADKHDEIDIWQNERWSQRGPIHNTLLWYSEEYLVVLKDRGDFWALKTAYCTHQHHRIARLRLERDFYLSANLKKQKPE